MKTLLFPTLALLFILCLFSFKQPNNIQPPDKHKKLIKWLNSNENTFSFNTAITEDSAIIKILTAASDYNKSRKDSTTTNKKESDAVDILNKAVTFNKRMESKSIEKTLPISFAKAQKFCDNFESGPRINGDNTKAILFTLPLLIDGMDASFDPDASDWIDLDFWEGKGFFVFPANYKTDRGTTDGRSNQHAAIIQFARETSTSNVWSVFPDQLYDFGDIKPPKISIINQDKAPN